jgi:D-glycero-alpha-D-manno-heptose 1-phosphate guanylyltransferase
MDKIDAIILAGGLGTRLRSVVSDVPKVLAPVNGRPFLDIILGALSKSGIIRRVVIAAGYMAEKVIEQYQGYNRFGIEIILSIERQLLGTGGAIKLALENTNSKYVMVLNGDSFIDISYIDLYKAHLQSSAQLTMVLKHVVNSNRYGSVALDGDKIISFQEKSDKATAGLINAGIYLFNRKLFDQVERDKVISMEKDLIPKMIKDDVCGIICNGRFIDIGLPETYSQVSNYLSEVLQRHES